MRYTSPILVALLLAAWCLAARPAGAQECIKCHVKPAEKATDPRVFNVDRWEGSVHATLDCITCHEGADPKAFDQLPHRLGGPPPACANCHDDDFREMAEAFQRSVHATHTHLDAFSCVQ